MRTPKEIKRKIKDLRYRYLQKKYKRLLACRPENCKFNFRQPLKGENTTIGLCIPDNRKEKNEVEWQGTICDDPEDAKKCDRYVCKFTKKRIAKEFDQEITEPEVCSEKYRDIFMLQWTLQEHKSFIQKILGLFKEKQESNGENND